MAGACLISASPKLRNRYQQPKLGALGQAELVRSSYGKIDLKLALNTHRFDFAEVQKMPGWLQELQGGHTPETEEPGFKIKTRETSGTSTYCKTIWPYLGPQTPPKAAKSQEYNISSLVFRSDKPFHPDRLEQLMFEGFDDLLRSKGLLWVAGRDHAALVWGQAGGAVTLEAGAWAHGSAPPEQWPPHLEKYKTRPWPEGFWQRICPDLSSLPDQHGMICTIISIILVLVPLVDL